MTTTATTAEKAHIGKLFDGLAYTYDRFNHLTSLGIDLWWRRVAAKAMRPAGEVLDVAAGTADFSIAALRHGKARHITGIDLSREMMNIGRAKVERAGYGDAVELMEASALDMPFADAAFDAVTCAYGIRNFSDLRAGLSEMHRVLRPGGQLVILEFSYPENPIVRFFYDLYFSHVMPLVGRILGGNGGTFAYFRRSVKEFVCGGRMAGILREAGFTNVTFRTLTFGITTLYLADRQ